MTPQEQQLVAELFDRLSKLETAPRDGDAERLIAAGARQAPHALYALVQTVLVQDEALKRASVRIQELQQQLEELAGDEPRQQQGSFLDSMRDAVFGQGAGHGADHDGRARSSVPSVQGSAYQSQQGYVPPRAAPAFPAQPPFPAGAPAGGPFGGSFLGTAASAAAGVIGGSLLLDGVRSMFNHRSGGNDPFASLFSRDAASSRGHAADSDLAHQAGIDDIGRRDFVVNQADDQDSTPASDDDQWVDNGNFDTADGGSGDDSYDV